MKIKLLLIVLLVPFVSGKSIAENAFTPLFNSPEAVNAVTTSVNVSDVDMELHPLLQHEVQNYILMAVIVSKNTKLALIRANNGGEYFIRTGDFLGKYEGQITAINGQGIEVTEKNKIVLLNVRNRSASNENTQ